jgi:DUF438 domain-containing protein
MAEGLTNHDRQREQLKEIVRELNEGTDIRQVKRRFHKLISGISPEEIAQVEQSLINEGMPVEHVQKLCDIHVQVFDEALRKQGGTKVIPGHPVHTYRMENRELRKRIRALKRSIRGPAEAFLSALRDLETIDLHYVRKENQLFPYLESVGFTGPSKVMWGKHDEIRELFRAVEKASPSGDAHAVKKSSGQLIRALRNMAFMEEKILFPTAMRKLPPSAWVAIRRGEPAIGYAWVQPGNLWDANIAGAKARSSEADLAVDPSEVTAAGSEGNGRHVESVRDGSIALDTGSLTHEQINLLLTHLPFDVTFVDEQGKVAFYSDGTDRIFPRSPGVIGRDVANCHPPKSVHVVEKVVEALKSGEKDRAEFWITLNNRFIHIRYFPVLDEAGSYRGIIEVSQDVTDIRALEGQRRLLDW